MWESYFSSLGLTLLIEVPIYSATLVSMLRVSLTSAALAGVAVNLVSHPIGFLVIGPAARSSLGVTLALVLTETIAVIGEWGLLLAWLKREPVTLLLISVLANGTSFLVGVALLH